MRLFISINIPRGLYRYCTQLQSQFPDLKTTREFHITLQFLGDEINETYLKTIIDALSKIQFQPFEILMGDSLPYPNTFSPKGVWIQCEMSDKLKNLAENIRGSMTELKLIPDNPFKPHITLGRYKYPPSDKPKTVKGEPHTFTVDRFYLMESNLMPAGAEYKVLAEFPNSKLI